MTDPLDSSVVVMGCGGVGLSAIQGAKASGAERIFAVDISSAKLELAKVFGATDVLLSEGVDTIRAIRAATGRRRFQRFVDRITTDSLRSVKFC